MKSKKPGVLIAIGIPKKENMINDTPDKAQDSDPSMQCYTIPKGIQVNDGDTITLPTETDFVAKNGYIMPKDVKSISGQPAEMTTGDEDEKENPTGDEGDDESAALDKEKSMWRDKAMAADQLGSGNMA